MEQMDNLVVLDGCLVDDEPGILCDRLNDLIAWQLKHNPSLVGKGKKDIAAKALISETSLKNMCNGKNNNPTVSVLKRIVRAVGGADLNVLAGFAPARDYGKEEETYDKTLMGIMEARLAEKRERIEDLTSQLSESEEHRQVLREKLLKKCESLSAAEAKIESMKAEVEEGAARRARRDKQAEELRDDFEKVRATLYKEREEHKKLRIALIVMCGVALLALCAAVYLLWDATNPTAGIFRY